MSESNDLHADKPFPPLDGGVDQAASLAGIRGRGSQPPFACQDDMRDALIDLTQDNRLSILRIEDPKCPMGACLERNGLARWAPKNGPGRWTITQLGWRFLETRTLNTGEVR